MKKNVTREKVIAQLIKWGNNEQDAVNMVAQEFDYVARVYAGQELTTGQVAEIIRTTY